MKGPAVSRHWGNMTRASICTFTVAAAVVLAGCDNQHIVGALDGTGGSGGVSAAGTGGSGGGGTSTGGMSGGAPGTGGSAGTAGAGGAGGMGGAAGSTVTGVAGSGQAGTGGPVTQSWTGYIENFSFPSGSDAIHITFTADASGQLTGTVILGQGTPPPPATDPDVTYPADLFSPGHVTDLGLAASRYISEGFTYTMRDASLVSGRLRFGFTTYELWTGWCALQQPAPGYTTCLPNWSSQGPGGTPDMTCALVNPTTQKTTTVDCGKLSLCLLDTPCACTMSACAVRTDGLVTRFDIAVSGSSGSGSVVGVLPMNNVHFTADP